MTTKFRQTVPSESQEQASLFQWARAKEREIPELAMLFAIPNYGAWNRKRLQVEGTRKGVPDLMLACPVPDAGEIGLCGLFIEMKRRDASPSDTKVDQTKWLNALTEYGYRAIVCRGWDEARIAILRYLGRET